MCVEQSKQSWSEYSCVVLPCLSVALSKGEDVEQIEADPPDVSNKDDDLDDASVVGVDDKDESTFDDDELLRPSS